MKSQGIANRTQMAPTGALKQHSDNTFLAPLTCFSSGELLCWVHGHSGPRKKRKKTLSKEKRQERESRNILIPRNSMISGGKKEQVVRQNARRATQILQLLFSLTPLQTHYNVCIFKSYLATHREGACVALEELCSDEQNSC